MADENNGGERRLFFKLSPVLVSGGVRRGETPFPPFVTLLRTPLDFPSGLGDIMSKTMFQLSGIRTRLTISLSEWRANLPSRPGYGIRAEERDRQHSRALLLFRCLSYELQKFIGREQIALPVFQPKIKWNPIRAGKTTICLLRRDNSFRKGSYKSAFYMPLFSKTLAPPIFLRKTPPTRQNEGKDITQKPVLFKTPPLRDRLFSPQRRTKPQFVRDTGNKSNAIGAYVSQIHNFCFLTVLNRRRYQQNHLSLPNIPSKSAKIDTKNRKRRFSFGRWHNVFRASRGYEGWRCQEKYPNVSRET